MRKLRKAQPWAGCSGPAPDRRWPRPRPPRPPTPHHPGPGAGTRPLCARPRRPHRTGRRPACRPRPAVGWRTLGRSVWGHPPLCGKRWRSHCVGESSRYDERHTYLRMVTTPIWAAVAPHAGSHFSPLQPALRLGGAGGGHRRRRGCHPGLLAGTPGLFQFGRFLGRYSIVGWARGRGQIFAI